MTQAEMLQAWRARRWALVISPLVLALVGYFGAWVPHRAAGLVLTGVDFAEVVKFIPEVQSGQIRLLREAFYLPLLAGSLIATLLAGRRSLPRSVRLIAFCAAFPLALAMLPPAWSPGLLLDPAFRIQVLAILFCGLAVFLIPLTRLLPDELVLLIIAILGLAAALWPASAFLQAVPPLRALYGTEVALIGWGFVLSTVGWLVTAFLALLALLRRPTPQRHPL